MDTAVGIAIGTLFTTIIAAIVGAIIQVSNHRFNQSKEKHSDTLNEHKILINELMVRDKERLTQIRELDHKLKLEIEEKAKCREDYARAEARIEALEDALMNAGIKFRPWKRMTESDNITEG